MSCFLVLVNVFIFVTEKGGEICFYTIYYFATTALSAAKTASVV